MVTGTPIGIGPNTADDRKRACRIKCFTKPLISQAATEAAWGECWVDVQATTDAAYPQLASMMSLNLNQAQQMTATGQYAIIFYAWDLKDHTNPVSAYWNDARFSAHA